MKKRISFVLAITIFIAATAIIFTAAYILSPITEKNYEGKNSSDINNTEKQLDQKNIGSSRGSANSDTQTTPQCKEQDWQASLSPTTCPLSEEQTRTWSKIGICSDGVTHPSSETTSCNYQAPTCTGFTYSDWGVCTSSNTQSRNVLTSSPSGCQGGSPITSQTCKSPLVVDANSHIIVMQYEPWWGPTKENSRGQNFEYSAAKPLLQSDSMQDLPGKGYDSADPNVITTHLQQLEDLGIDAIGVDMSNGLACLFGNGVEFCGSTTLSQSRTNLKLKTILRNIEVLYDELSKSDSDIKIIPLTGAQDTDMFAVNSLGTIGVAEGFKFFIDLQEQYPELSVIYEGKPLITAYHGAPQSISPLSPNNWWKQTEDLLLSTGLDDKFTLRHVAGFVDGQPNIREYGTESRISPIKQGYQFWTWTDRYNEEFGYYPSYQLHNGIVEAFTVSVATVGRHFYSADPTRQSNLDWVPESECYVPQPGKISCAWGSPPNNYADDVSLRNNGDYFRKYMLIARDLQPTLLFIHQWNEYTPNDQGFDTQTINDIEPTDLWGWDMYDVVKEELEIYKESTSS